MGKSSAQVVQVVRVHSCCPRCPRGRLLTNPVAHLPAPILPCPATHPPFTAQQKSEAQTNAEYGKNFKKQPTKEDKAAKRKQILSTIGEDLLVASADKPFRFPATFTCE